jgi:hypothetical protein
MIKAKLSKNRVIISGHANFNDYGKDIVCAAVSSIITASVNDIYIVNPNALNYSDDGKIITIEIIKDDDLVYKLLNNLQELLINLSEDYPKNIKIERED